MADYVHVLTRITAVLPDAETAARLEMREAQPVLSVCAVISGLDGQPIQHSETAFCAERVQFVMEAPGK